MRIGWARESDEVSELQESHPQLRERCKGRVQGQGWRAGGEVANRLGIDFEDAYMLSSAVADLRVSQVVDPLMASRRVISKKYL